MEIWKDIEGWPGYKVSTEGRVSGPRSKNLKLVKGNNGYMKVTLSFKGKHKDKRVNRLVAEAFIPNPKNYPLVMHYDNNPMNNNVDNLSWGIYAENNKWMYTCNRHPINFTDETREKVYAKRRVLIVAIDSETGESTYVISQGEAARQLGVSQQHIWGVLNGYRRSTGGYHFKYAEDGDANG